MIEVPKSRTFCDNSTNISTYYWFYNNNYNYLTVTWYISITKFLLTLIFLICCNPLVQNS